MGKIDFLFPFILGAILTLFIVTAIEPLGSIFTGPTAAAIYDIPEVIIDKDIPEAKTDYSLLNESFQSSEATTYAAECKPHAYIIGGNVTKYECNLYYEDEVDVRKVSPTGSMWPNLISGGYVLISGIKNISELSVGDIIIISDMAGNEIAHRITEVSYDNLGPYIVTQGDNNPTSDGIRFRSSDIIAKVVGILY